MTATRALLPAVLVVAALAAPAAGEGEAFAQRASATETNKATAHFQKGTELFKEKKLAPALEHFKQSYAIVPSPNSHLYIARCLAGLGQTRAAYLEYDRVIEEASAQEKYARTRDTARDERDEVGSKLAFVTINVKSWEPAMMVRAGNYELPADRVGKPFPVEPGTIDVSVQAPGKPLIRQTVTVTAGQRLDVPIDANAGPAPAPAAPPPPEAPPPPPAPMSPLRIGAFVAGGVGVVGFTMFAVGGALSKSTYSSLETICMHQQACPNPIGGRAAADDKISSGKTQQAVANAGVTIGAIGLAAGVTLFVLSLRKTEPAPETPAASLVVGPSWIGAKGSF